MSTLRQKLEAMGPVDMLGDAPVEEATVENESVEDAAVVDASVVEATVEDASAEEADEVEVVAGILGCTMLGATNTAFLID